MTYRLEYNEEQQCFHKASSRDIPNTNGWFTVIPECTDSICHAFKAYIKYNPGATYTRSQMEDLADKFETFRDKLYLYGLGIVDLTNQDL